MRSTSQGRASAGNPRISQLFLFADRLAQIGSRGKVPLLPRRPAAGPQPPQLTTRRAFLERSAAVAAALSLPGSLAACGGGDDEGEIVRAAIHPAIGIGRVGNSETSFFFGPELPGTLPHAPQGVKDATGAVARQAARFRVYGLDAAGRPVREITSREADIAWHVNVANTKAAWYEFGTAFDIPGAAPADIRNAGVKDRSLLVIAPGEKSVRGAASGPVALDGSFHSEKVHLGELMTDEVGRLVVLPGPGRGYTDGTASLTTFAGNDGWADDVCDGVVRATVRIDGRTIPTESAWVLTTPPNYGPGIATGFITLYDAVRSALVDGGMLDPGTVSLREDILPLFARLDDMQWVNEGYFRENGFGSGGEWLSQSTLERLADPSQTAAEYRQNVFSQFRDPSFLVSQQDAVPDMYGDDVSIPQTSARQWLAVTPLQYSKLGAWARGRFTDDRAEASGEARSVADLPVAEQPRSLDRAALESCLGGAFHPGIEAPWTMRRPSLWVKAFRLRVRSTEVDDRDWGAKLTQEKALAPDGPLDGVAPGDLTRWQGVPWHSDAASCRSGYQREISTVLPTFWPARIPNQVLIEDDYRIVMDRSRPLAERREAFARRHDWERFIAKKARPKTLALMIKDWSKLGMVTERPGPGDAEFPATLKVETGVGFDHEPKHEYGADEWVPQG